MIASPHVDTPLARLAWATAGATLLLLVAGSLVTGTDAGDSVPDWPLAFGALVPLRHLGGKVVFEYGHRVIAGLVTLLMLTLVIVTVRREPRVWVRRATASALAVIAFQAGLGGLRVAIGDAGSGVVAMIHAFFAQVTFAAAVSLALFHSPGFARLRSLQRRPDWLSGRLLTLVWMSGALLLAQILLGAAFRHHLLGIGLHIVGAAAVAVVLGAAAGVVAGRARSWAAAAGQEPQAKETARLFTRPAAAAGWILLAQLALGVVTYFLLKAVPAGASPPVVTVALASIHLVAGAVLLAGAIVLIVRLAAVPAPARA